MWSCEENIVRRVGYLAKKEDEKLKNIDKYILEIQQDLAITYNEEQLNAIKDAITKTF